MATADVVCVVILLLFGLIGLVRGFRRQASSLAAFALIALFAVPLGVTIAEPAARAWDYSGPSARNLKIAAALGAAFVIYVIVKLAGAAINRAVCKRIEGERGTAPWSRCWGGALGIVKAGVLCWLVLCFFVAFPGIAPRTTASVDKSWSAKTTGLWNPFAHWIKKDTA